ncbi:MAG TPA: hypothetical protein VNF27_00020 [Candidatus Binataceae bacterium]|nr:hypothetical protein [Candidatus Binataceae bacterium]
MKLIILQMLIALHLLFAAVFVGSNIFLDFLLTPSLDVIPPGQAARLGDKLGTQFAILNWITLLGLPLTGFLLLWRLGDLPALMNHRYYMTGYGGALLLMILIWVSLMVTAAILTFYLRPRVIVKLPFDTTRQQVEGARADSILYAGWMQKLARYNAVSSSVAIVVGGVLRFGGFHL